MARFLKYGISTGATAAAAAKAAVLAMTCAKVDKVVIPTPIGIRFEIPVKTTQKISKDTATATVVKDAGEDIDVTHGMDIIATVKITDQPENIVIKSGKGVGVVTKPGLQVPVGEGAINPVPRKMINDAVKEALPIGKGAEVTITAPDGEKIAEKTFNAKIGIVGGVSIIGTSGVVKPLSQEACRRSLVPQIDVAIANKFEHIFFVPGSIGERFAKQLFNAPEEQIVQTGDFVGYMLDKALEKGVKKIIFLGHSGKLVKVAAGIFNTHYRMGDARNELIAAYAGAVGADTDTVNLILQSNTTDEATAILNNFNLTKATYDKIAQKIHTKVTERTKNQIKISVVIVAMDGRILGKDEKGRIQNK
ncbi:MAG: cobalamin biosynthesis protein CbiD [Crenarchaeota archaeon]|nr:cobalamin biosynthesis protein CbiD [Thermoproteota archaeon]